MRKLELIVCCIVFIVTSVQRVETVDFVYHNYTELTEILQKFSAVNHSKIHTKLYSIGKSWEDRELWVLEITAAQNKSGVPNVKLIGGVFGNQPVGIEILLHFIEHFLRSYGTDEHITHLLNNVKLHILPCMNPDGRAVNATANSRKIPLHKAFPDLYIKNNLPNQRESEAIIKWMQQTPFVLSASLKSKGRVVVYPYSTVKNYVRFSNKTSLTPDNDVFVNLSKLYSSNRPIIVSKDEQCNARNSNFTDGILNGAALMQQDGTMQDYNYFKHGCMELNIGVSCTPLPPVETLEGYWNENKNALIQYFLKANQGIHGVVKDSSTGKPIQATYSIVGRNIKFSTNEKGEFWKVLLNGTYEIQVTAKGYNKKSVKFEIKFNSPFPTLKHLKISLNSGILTTTSVPTEPEIVTGDHQSTQVQPQDPVIGTLVSCASAYTILPYLVVLNLFTFLIYT